MGKPRKRKSGLSRRQFLRNAGSIGLLPVLGACTGDSPSLPPSSVAADNPFQHGVASGDPLTDRMVFWTRVSGANGQPRVPVTLKVYADPQLQDLVVQIRSFALAERDYTVTIDQGGLQPGTTYYYRFETGSYRSVTGRTRTAPRSGVERLRFGIVSCASLAHGYFNAYRLLAQRADVDAVIHLGDYLYEYGTGEYGTARPYEPDHEMVTLADYRMRHAYYKRDADLMELHRQFPFIATWDDHESTNNSWRDGAENHTEGMEGTWNQRKAWAQQAYAEWMPIRYPQSGNVNRIFRKFSYGDLADVFILDTRLYDRDEPDGIPASAKSHRPERKMLGPEQMQWLLDGLSASAAQWKLVGQQVVFHQWQLPGAPKDAGGGMQLNGDAWDGYKAERQQIIDFVRERRLDNVVILAGDVHSSWCADITDDPANPLAYNPATGAGSVAVEFVTTSITSSFVFDFPEGQQAFLAANPHIRYNDLDGKGYLLLDLTRDRAQGEYWYVSTIREPGGNENFAIAYRAEDGANHLRLVPETEPSPPPPAPPLAP